MRLAKAAIWVVVVLAAVLASGRTVMAETGQDGQPVKAAILYNSSGPMASIDEPAYKGAMLAAKLINAQGGILIGGKLTPLELIPTDTVSNIAKVSQAASDENNKDVVAAIGYGDGAFVMSAASPFVNKGIPFISPGVTLPTLSKVLGSNFFMVAYGDDAQGRAMADYTFKTLNKKTITVWTDLSMAYTLTVSDSFKERYRELGGTVIYETTFRSGTSTPPDFPKMVEQLAAYDPKPEAVFIAAIDEEAALLVKLLRNSGIDIPIVSADGFDTPMLEKAVTSKPITNVFFTTHAFRADARAEVASFIKAYKKEYGADPLSAYAALGYDAVNILADSIKRAGSADKEAIAKALEQTKDFKAITGPITMRPLMPPEKSIAIVEIKDGKYTQVDTWKP